MSFIAQFHTFNLAITNVDSTLYVQKRFRIPRHELESLRHLYARVLTLCHAFREGMEFTTDDHAAPGLIAFDSLGIQTTWISVGCPSEKNVHRALKNTTLSDLRIYFYNDQQILEFCRYLRGAKENWAGRIRFWRLEETLLDQLEESAPTSEDWAITIVDASIYLTLNNLEFVSSISEIDIWQHFQGTIRNISSL